MKQSKEKSCKTCRFLNSCTDRLQMKARQALIDRNKEAFKNALLAIVSFNTSSFCKDWLDSIPYQGGFSEKVWNDKELQNYIKGCKGLVLGYVGHPNRTDNYDRLIENTLKECHISSKGIAHKITSTMGRHLADNPITKERIVNILT